MASGSRKIDRTRIRGSSEANASWNISWMPGGWRRRWRGDMVASSVPLNTIDPAVGCSSPTSSLAMLVLPQPDSPTRPKV